MPVDRYGTITNVLGNGSANIILPDTPSDDTLDIPYPALKDALFYTPYEVQQRRHAYYAEIISLDVNWAIY